MTGIILLEIISIVSFIYSLLLMFFSFASLNEIFIVFIWTIIVSSIFALNHKKSKIYQIIMLLLLAPLIFYHSMSSVYFLITTATIVYVYMTKSLMKGSYDEYVNKFKKTYIMYGVACFLALINRGFRNDIKSSVPFIIIYLMTTIILVRLIRHLESGMDMKKIRQVNSRYLGMISVISFIVALDNLRTFIFSIIKNMYFFAIDIIMKLLYYPITIIANIVNKVIAYIIEKIIANGKGVLGELLGELTENEPIPMEEVSEIYYSSIRTVMEILLIIFIIYMIYKIIIKVGDRSYKGLEYTEEREYIREPKKKKKRFTREKYPRELNQQIRYYYRRYLEKLDKKDVKILKTDTSLEVNEKAEDIFEDKIQRIRKIYIDSRYGNKDVDKNMVEEMENLYKKL